MKQTAKYVINDRLPPQKKKVKGWRDSIFNYCLLASLSNQKQLRNELIKTNTIIAIYFLKSIFLFHIAIAFWLPSQILLIKENTSSKEFIIYRVIQFSIVSAIIIQIVFLLQTARKQLLSHKLSHFYKIVLSYTNILNETLLSASGLLMLVDIQQNISIFVTSALVNLYSLFFLDNYVVRKDELYHSSIHSNFFFKCIIIICFVINSCLTDFRKQSCKQVILLQFVLLVAWFMISGHRLYLHRIPKLCLQLFLSLYNCLVYLVFKISSFQEQFQIVSITLELLLSLSISFFIYNIYSQRIPHFTFIAKIKKQKIKNLDLFINSILSQSHRNLFTNSYLLGLFKTHEDYHCSNPKCYSHSLSIYDPLLTQTVPVKGKLNRQLQPYYKRLIICLYEQQHVLQSQNYSIMLDYLQLILNEFSNGFIIGQYISKIQCLNVGLFDKIRLQKIKIQYKLKLNQFNEHYYQGKLNAETVIQSQLIFINIQQHINSYIFQQMTIWEAMKNHQIHLSTLKDKLNACFQFQKEIGKNWNKIIPHFGHQKKWCYIYHIYQLFLKNVKPTSKILNQFQQKSEPHIFEPQTITNRKNIQLDKSFAKILLFHANSFSIHTIFQNDELLITTTSQNTKRITGYQKIQLQRCPLKQLLQVQVANKHDLIFREWSINGLSMNQTAYVSRITKIVRKDKTQVSVIKYYKMFVNAIGQVQYVCLLNICSDTSSLDIKSVESTNNKAKFDDKRFSGLHGLLKQQSEKNEMPQNSTKKGWNLIADNNLFLKQQKYQPVKQTKDISHFKTAVRLFSCLLLISIASLSLLTNSQITDSNNYNREYISFMQVYRIPMVLGNNYFKSLLKLGNQTKLNAQINALSKQMQSVSQLTTTLKTLFNGKINKPQMYSPHQINQINQNRAYDQIQLFNLIRSNIISLSQLPINQKSNDFLQFNSYIKPGYDHMINTTKNSFHEAFQTFFANVLLKEQLVTVAQGVLFFIFLGLSIKIVFGLFQELRVLVNVLTSLKAKDVSLIYHYWANIFLMFQHLGFKERYDSETNIINTHSQRRIQFKMTDKVINEANNQIYLNKRQKKIQAQNQSKRFKIKLFLLLTIALIIPTTTMLIVQINTILNLQKLIIFQNEGFSFLRYFPAAAMVSYGCLQKYYFMNSQNVNGSTFNNSRYDDALTAMKLMGQFQYIGQIEDSSSLYYLKQKEYFFGDVCAFDPNVLKNTGVDLNKCRSLINNSLNLGITAYMRAGFNLADSFLNKNMSITSATLQQFSLSITVASTFILDAITSWSNEFNKRMTAYTQNIFNSSLLNCCLCIFSHLLLIQFLLFGELQKQYDVYRRMFSLMMPQFILKQEKVTCQQLVKAGFLSQHQS